MLTRPDRPPAPPTAVGAVAGAAAVVVAGSRGGGGSLPAARTALATLAFARVAGPFPALVTVHDGGTVGTLAATDDNVTVPWLTDSSLPA